MKKYIYTFSWIDENNDICGWNDTTADNIKEARANAKKEGTKAHWSLWDGSTYVTVPNEVVGGEHCFRMKGMMPKMDSFRKTTIKQRNENHHLADMMCR